MNRQELRRGVVREINEDTIIVAAPRRGACENCSEKGLCFALGKDRPERIEAVNRLGAKIGDVVELSSKPGTFLQASLAVYLLLMLGLLCGAFIGDGLGDSDLSAIFGGVAGFISALILAVAIDRWAKHSRRFLPEVASILDNVKLCDLPNGDISD